MRKPKNCSTLLEKFRIVAKSQSKSFFEKKDHIFNLLGSQQNAESGRFREELLRDFLQKMLPSNVAVDTGFIYGFEEVETSRQLDIIIWHRGLHSPVYDAGNFVIVSPESVIAVVSVKSIMSKREIRHGLENLLSIAPLDLKFRSNFVLNKTQKPIPAIAKFLVFFSQPPSADEILAEIERFYAELHIKNSELLNTLIGPLQTINPRDVDDEIWEAVRRIYPRLITTIEEGDANYVQGWGPPDDIYGDKTYGPDLKRLPYMYRHDTKITTAFEKFFFFILEAVYTALETPGMSLLSAWGDLNPSTGVRSGDVWEIIEKNGVPLLDVSAME